MAACPATQISVPAGIVCAELKQLPLGIIDVRLRDQTERQHIHWPVHAEEADLGSRQIGTQVQATEAAAGGHHCTHQPAQFVALTTQGGEHEAGSVCTGEMTQQG